MTTPHVDAVDADDLPAYEPDWTLLATTTDEDPFMDAGVELLKGAGTAAAYAAASAEGLPHARDAAIRCGLLVRASKIALALVRDACRDNGALQIALSRMLVETVVNLRYLCADDAAGTRHAAFVQDSLISEREFLKTITARIASDPSGRPLPIEERMLRSIHGAAEAAGVRLEDVPSRGSNGWPSAQQRVADAFGERAYLSFRAGSDALHGGWYDLFRNHLSEVDGGFEPDFIGVRIRPQALLMAAAQVSLACGDYLSRRPATDWELLGPGAERLFRTSMRVAGVHEAFLAGDS